MSKVKIVYATPTDIFAKCARVMARVGTESIGHPTPEWLAKALSVVKASGDREVQQAAELALMGVVLMHLTAAENITDEQRKLLVLLNSTSAVAAAHFSLEINAPELVRPSANFGGVEFDDTAPSPRKTDRDLLRHPNAEIRALAEAHFGVTPEPPKPVDTAPLANLKPVAE